MEIDYLNEFLVLTDSPNLSEAADQLSVSESSLSRHIKVIEDEFGCSLFDRTSRTFRLNKYGRMFLPYARDLIALRQRCATVLHDAKVREASSVSIAANYNISSLLDAFYDDHPGILTSLIEVPKNEEDIKGALRSQECTFSISVTFHDTYNEFETVPLIDDRFVAILPADHPLARTDSIDVSDLYGENFLSFRSNSTGDIYIKKICHKAGFDPTIVSTCDNGFSIMKKIMRGDGISILHRGTLNDLGTDFNKIAIMRLVPDEEFTVTLAYRKGIQFTNAEQLFLDFCLKYAAKRRDP